MKQLVLGVDDTLMKQTPRTIPRADVASLAVACIGLPVAERRSFDVVARPLEGDSPSNNDVKALLTAMKDNCDYSINSQA
jgi:hypothetical protein